ncbi:MAG: ferritin-like domain-containing protein [Myxococcota bacterium]
MRDTQGLRTRIALLACVPGLLACSPPPKPQPVDQDEQTNRRDRTTAKRNRSGQDDPSKDKKPLPVDERRKRYYEAKARQAGKTVDEVTPPAQRRAERANALTERQRQAAERRTQTKTSGSASPGSTAAAGPNTVSTAVAGDPPYIDGYNPEEESCISGNWCGAIDAVRAVAVDAVPEQIDCPTRIAGGKASETIKADPKTYEGLSPAPNMQGALNQHGTELARAKPGNDTTCCYHWFEYCSGRPHLGDDGPVLAPVEPGDTWLEVPATPKPTSKPAPESTTEPAPEQGDAWPDAPTTPVTPVAPEAPAPLPEALRGLVAGAWLDDARAEHASIAAFARATLELMALGAPPELIALAQQAGLDEITHARRCFGLAARYGAGAMQPGPLPALAPRPADLARLAADTFAEGCVGETIAALTAQRSLRHCADPVAAATLRQIADDEARHAALAWSTLHWALHADGSSVADALRDAAASLRADHQAPLPPVDPDAPRLARHGRLDARAHALTARDAWEEVIEPMLESLLAETNQPKDATRA